MWNKFNFFLARARTAFDAGPNDKLSALTVAHIFSLGSAFSWMTHPRKLSGGRECLKGSSRISWSTEVEPLPAV